MIECPDVEPLLAIHAVEETDVGEALRVEQHIAGCTACREILETYRTIRETVRRDRRTTPEAPALSLAGRPGAGAVARVWAPRLAAAALLLAAGLLIGRWSAPGVGPATPTGAARPTVAAVRAPEPAPGATRGLALSVFSPAARQYLEQAARSGRDGGEAPRRGTAP